MFERLARKQTIIGLVLMVLGLVFAPATMAASQAVDIQGFAFSPATITVAVGDTLTWSNKDGVAHTATADDASFDTGNIAAGGTGTATFSTAGTFAYHCTIHSSMKGTVVVQAAAATPGATTRATTPPTSTADPAGPSGAASTAPAVLAVVAVVSFVAFGSVLGRKGRRAGR